MKALGGVGEGDEGAGECWLYWACSVQQGEGDE